MKFTPSESKLLTLIAAMPGGSYCPGADIRITPEVARITRKLERKGALYSEGTDDGPSFTLTTIGWEEARNG